MTHSEYNLARNRNLLTLRRLGVKRAGSEYPKLGYLLSTSTRYTDQLAAMSDHISMLNKRKVKR